MVVRRACFGRSQKSSLWTFRCYLLSFSTTADVVSFSCEHNAVSVKKILLVYTLVARSIDVVFVLATRGVTSVAPLLLHT